MRTHVLLLALATSLALAGSADAATFTVNTTADPAPAGVNPCDTPGAAGCSLRDAVIAADAAPGSTIDVPAGTYALTIPQGAVATDTAAAGDLDVNQPTAIVGAGAGLTIVQQQTPDRVFQAQSTDDTGTVSFSGLTITGGHPAGDGGGIDASGVGTVSIAGSAISGNTQTRGNGGGVADTQASTTTLSIVNSTLSGNGAGGTTGGGVWSSAQTSISNSTVSGNTGDAGGGIHVEGAPGSITNATVAFNTAGGGVPGGIEAANAKVNVQNSIASNNGGGNCIAGALPQSTGNNIDDGATCGFTQASDHQNTSPQLGPLGDNGGTTQTHALPKASPAVDAGDNTTCPLTDQRGQVRPFDGNDDGLATCDIGAFELRGPPPAVTTGLAGAITPGGALVGGAVNPNGFLARYHFDFGPTAAYGSSTPPVSAGAGAATVPVVATLTGLVPKTTYHYRLVATNAAGTVSGADATFTTSFGAPTLAVSANLEPLKGQVFVALPAVQKSARGAVLRRRFGPLIRLRDAAQVPMGSLLKTDHGTARMTTATLKPGHTQVGDFSKGTFIIGQSKKTSLTTASLNGGGLNACSKLPRGGAPKTVAAARRRHRSLFANVHGHFRTRGRNSSATVRGTEFLVKDNCKGTMTIVRRGVVTVHDFRLRKNVKVKAHHRYFAQAPKRRR